MSRAVEFLTEVVTVLYFGGGKRRCSDMGHPGNADELLEILGNELRPVIRNDPGPSVRILLFGPLPPPFGYR
jgi:hypothetical protein